MSGINGAKGPDGNLEKLKAAMADGKVTEEEYDKLTPQEQLILQSAFGFKKHPMLPYWVKSSNNEKKEDLTLKERLKPENTKKDWEEMPLVQKVLGGILVAGAAVLGGVATAGVAGVAGIASATKGAIAAAGVGALGLTSCHKPEDDYNLSSNNTFIFEGDNNETNLTLNITVEVVNKNLDTLIDALVEQGEELSDVLKSILAQLRTIDNNMNEYNNIQLEFLNKIISAINTLRNSNQETSSAALEVLNKILTKISDLDENTALILNQILNKISNLDENTALILNTVLNLDINDANVRALLQQIIVNQDLSHETLSLILGELATGNRSLDDIKVLLELINDKGAQVLQNQNSQTAIMNNIGVITQRILTKLLALEGLSTTIIAKLNAILDKIPDGCHCQPADLSNIIELLQTIIEKLENGGGNEDNNEGVDDDLSDLEEYFN